MFDQFRQPIQLFMADADPTVGNGYLRPELSAMHTTLPSQQVLQRKQAKLKPQTPPSTAMPVILHTRQYVHQQTPVTNFQCDCACPDDGFALAAPQPFNLQTPLEQPFLHRQPLSVDYQLMFNPFHDQGVALLNQAAQQLWAQFQQPRHLHDVVQTDSARDITPDVQTLCELGLLQPVGQQPQPRKSAPQVLNTWIHVTNECNLRCDYCYINKTNNDMSEEVGIGFRLDKCLGRAIAEQNQRRTRRPEDTRAQIACALHVQAGLYDAWHTESQRR